MHTLTTQQGKSTKLQPGDQIYWHKTRGYITISRQDHGGPTRLLLWDGDTKHFPLTRSLDIGEFRLLAKLLATIAGLQIEKEIKMIGGLAVLLVATDAT